ncbi:MAG: hypothetical protein M1570_11565 [Chloroflexi bacterium]|nr:hypothetical protein [Chloroflexota bacterium]
MYEDRPPRNKVGQDTLGPHKLLRPNLIFIIEHALKEVKPYGEIHLVVERGRVRLVRIVKSEQVDNAVSSRGKPELPGD